MKTNHERLREIFARLDSLDYVKPEQIPDIDLYMDQVTTFMDEHLQKSKRYEQDKVLTKTMINNYAKNNLLPPPVKKKYSKEHMLLLIYIYYFKNMLAFNDIEALFRPITEDHFMDASGLSLQDIYRQIFSLETEQMILGIVVDHGLGQDLVLRVAFGGLQMFFHERGHLIHIQIYIRNLLRPDVIDPVQAGEYAAQDVLRVYRHIYHLITHYIVFKTT